MTTSRPGVLRRSRSSPRCRHVALPPSSRHWKRAHWLGYIEPRRFAANASLYRPQGQGCSGVPTPGRVQARHRWASSGTCSASMRSTTLGVAASSATRASHWSTITPLWTRAVNAGAYASVESSPEMGQLHCGSSPSVQQPRPRALVQSGLYALVDQAVKPTTAPRRRPHRRARRRTRPRRGSGPIGRRGRNRLRTACRRGPGRCSPRRSGPSS